jgi:hypothetical protein
MPLNIDGQHYPIEARVIRVSQTLALRSVVVVFVEVRNDLQTVLSRNMVKPVEAYFLLP